ncbi:thiamine biosynthesis protein ThiJ, partial [Paracoccus sp. PXZ]
MPDTALKPVMILFLDRFADWETPLISGIGGDFYGLTVRHVTPGGGAIRSMGGLSVTGLEDAVPREDEVIV